MNNFCIALLVLAGVHLAVMAGFQLTLLAIYWLNQGMYRTSECRPRPAYKMKYITISAIMAAVMGRCPNTWNKTTTKHIFLIETPQQSCFLVVNRCFKLSFYDAGVGSDRVRHGLQDSSIMSGCQDLKKVHLLSTVLNE